MKTLCLYYTRTNITKTAMEHLAKLLEADLAEYTDGKDRSGVTGYIGACFASMKKSYPAITIKGDVRVEFVNVSSGMLEAFFCVQICISLAYSFVFQKYFEKRCYLVILMRFQLFAGSIWIK